MANGIQNISQNFSPMAAPDYDKLLKGITTRSGKLMADIKVACLNAVYYSVVDGRPQPAERLLMSVPKYLQGQVKTFLEQAGKLGFQGTGREKKLAYVNKDKAKIGDKEFTVPKAEDKEAGLEYVKSLPLEFKRNPRERKPVTNQDWHQFAKDMLGKAEKISENLNKSREAGIEVNEKHYELIAGFLEVFRKYEHDVMGIYGEEETETDEERELRELREENARLKAEAAKNTGTDTQAGQADLEGREPMQKVG